MSDYNYSFNYEDMNNKPQIDGEELIGNKVLPLLDEETFQEKIDYLESGGVIDTLDFSFTKNEIHNIFAQAKQNLND